MVNMEAREVVSRYNQLIKKCCVGTKRKMKRVNFLDDVVGGEEDICPPGTASPGANDLLDYYSRITPGGNECEGAEYSFGVEPDTNDPPASKITSELIEDQGKVGNIDDYNLEIIPCVVIDDDSLSYSSLSSVEILDGEGGEDIFPPGEEPSSSSSSLDNHPESEENLQKLNAESRRQSTEKQEKRSPGEHAAHQADKLRNAVDILSANGIETGGLTKSQIFHRVRRVHKYQRLQSGAIAYAAPWSELTAAPTDKSKAPSKLNSKERRQSTEKQEMTVKRSPEEHAAYQADKLSKAVEILNANGIETSGLTQSQIFHRVRRVHKYKRLQSAQRAKVTVNSKERRMEKRRIERKSSLSKQLVEGKTEEPICPPGEEEPCDERNGAEGFVEGDLEDISDDCEEVVEIDAPDDDAASKVQSGEGGFSDWSLSDEEEPNPSYKISRIISERGEAIVEPASEILDRKDSVSVKSRRLRNFGKGGSRTRNQEYRQGESQRIKSYIAKMEARRLKKKLDKRCQMQSKLHDEEGLCPPGEEPTSNARSIATVVGVRDVDLGQGASQSQD